jgi:hypothetical protein
MTTGDKTTRDVLEGASLMHNDVRVTIGQTKYVEQVVRTGREGYYRLKDSGIEFSHAEVLARHDKLGYNKWR